MGCAVTRSLRWLPLFQRAQEVGGAMSGGRTWRCLLAARQLGSAAAFGAVVKHQARPCVSPEGVGVVEHQGVVGVHHHQVVALRGGQGKERNLDSMRRMARSSS